LLVLLSAVLGVANACRAQPEAPQGYEYYSAGDVAAQTPGTAQFGLMLMGGGDWSRDAWQWFAEKAGAGHIVILRASQDGSDGQWIVDEIGGVASVQTLVFSSREAAYDSDLIAIIERADAVFIAGGDQSKYVRFWKDTPVEAALNAHLDAGRPLGGTSAGLAIMGGAGYGAMAVTAVDSPTALADPHGPLVTLAREFIDAPFLTHVITDTHFTERDRLGRLIAFVAQSRDTADPDAVGLGVDEDSVIIVEADGTGRFFTTTDGKAWLVQPAGPPAFDADGALEWGAISLVGVGPGSVIDLNTLEVSDPTFRRTARVENGQLFVTASAQN
jgi:beta-aspartyl-peptidase (threonine type)